jgi:hypothetical protein
VVGLLLRHLAAAILLFLEATYEKENGVIDGLHTTKELVRTCEIVSLQVLMEIVRHEAHSGGEEELPLVGKRLGRQRCAPQSLVEVCGVALSRACSK